MGKIIDCIMSVAREEVPKIVGTKSAPTNKEHYLRKFAHCLVTKKK